MTEKSNRSSEAHEVKAYVGIARSAGEEDEPALQDAIHAAAEFAYTADRDNVGKLFDVVRVQLVLSNPHIKELRATIARSDTGGA